MVQIVIKKGDQVQFLLETLVSTEIKCLIENVCEIYNFRLKIFRIADQLKELAEHGVSLPPNMQVICNSIRLNVISGING